MPGLSLLTIAASVAMGVNIGANNSAAAMGPDYGAGVHSRREAATLIAVFCIAGAVFAGHRVMATIGQELIGRETLTASPSGVLIVVVSMLGLLVLANLLRIPISTSHIAVGAVVGLGLFYGSANLRLAVAVIGWWIITPLVALSVSYLLARFLYPRMILWIGALRSEDKARRVLAWSVTLSGCWMAFSAGSNNLANAMGPVVGAGVFSPTSGALIGGVTMALGALLLGGRLMTTVGKEITSICPLCAVLVQMISASIVFAASRFGMPVSLAEIVTCSVIGFSCATTGLRETAGNHLVRRMLVRWPAAPVTAGAITFGLLALA